MSYTTCPKCDGRMKSSSTQCADCRRKSHRANTCVDCDTIILSTSTRCVDCYRAATTASPALCVDCGKMLGRWHDARNSRCRGCYADVRKSQRQERLAEYLDDIALGLTMPEIARSRGVRVLSLQRFFYRVNRPDLAAECQPHVERWRTAA